MHRPQVIRERSALDDLLSADLRNKQGKLQGNYSDPQPDVKGQPVRTDKDSPTIQQRMKISEVKGTFLLYNYFK